MTAVAELINVDAFINGRKALDQVSVEFPERSFTVIFGPNGAGKSTLLRILIGQIQPTAGEVRILGGSVERNRTKIGYVPQDFFQRKDFPISVGKTVLTGRYGKVGIFGQLRSEDIEQADQALENVGLLELRDRPLGELSGGELQRVFIARAIAAEPKLLLLDEAASGVDVGVKESLYELLLRLKEEMAIVFVSHDMSVVSTGVDLVACLDRKLVSHGSPEEALTEEALECMYGRDMAAFSHCHMPHVHVDHHHSHHKGHGEEDD